MAIKKINKIEMSQEDYDNLELNLRAKMIEEVLEENSKFGYFPIWQYVAVLIGAPIFINILVGMIVSELNVFIVWVGFLELLLLFGMYFAMMVNIYKQITRWGTKK